jgi:Domain of unknown function (DUF4390)
MRIRTVAAVACLAAAVGAAGARTPNLVNVQIVPAGDQYVASCRLESGLTPEILEEIDAGLETTISYKLNVYRKRTGFVDETMVRRRVRCTVRHDSLTRQYTLTRRVDGEVQDTQVTEDPKIMREFLTSLDRLPLLARNEILEGQEYYLKAKADVGLIWRFYLIPWPLDTDWVRVPLGPAEGRSLDAKP